MRKVRRTRWGRGGGKALSLGRQVDWFLDVSIRVMPRIGSRPPRPPSPKPESPTCCPYAPSCDPRKINNKIEVITLQVCQGHRKKVLPRSLLIADLEPLQEAAARAHTPLSPRHNNDNYTNNYQDLRSAENC